MPVFQRYDPTPCGYPAPAVPVLPTLNCRDLLPVAGHAAPPLHADAAPAADAGEVVDAAPLLRGAAVRHYARGRYALLAAYRLAGVGPGGAVLLPSYHCRTMVDPVLALGAAFQCYPLQDDLTPAAGSIAALLAQANGAVRALVLPHYFGIEQSAALMAELAALCQAHHVLLIEDCSHAWTVALRRAAAWQAAGAVANHVVLASPYKYYACADGGVLWGAPALLRGLCTHGQGWRAELRGALDLWRRRRVDAAALPDSRAQLAGARDGPAALDQLEQHSAPGSQYEPGLADRRSLALSRWVMRMAPPGLVARQRRLRYNQWLQALAGCSGARVLAPQLAPACAPYMLPLLINDPASQFAALKRAGVPVWRWDEMALSSCPVAGHYRLHLLHLPCHQSLSERQMAWLCRTVAGVLA
jgi:dTDP-4-amino-4,6-dideoxygalactose transaminase